MRYLFLLFSLVVSLTTYSQKSLVMDKEKTEKLESVIAEHICRKKLFGNMGKYLEKRGIYGMSDPPDKKLVYLRKMELDTLWEKGFAGYKSDVYPLLAELFDQKESYWIDETSIFEKTKTCRAARINEYYKSELNHLLQDIVNYGKIDYLKKKTNIILKKIQDRLIERTNQEWEITCHPFGNLLIGSIQLENPSGKWDKAGVIIYGRYISDIHQKLASLNISAPYKLKAYSNHLNILCWMDDKNLENIIDIVKEVDG